MFNLKNVEEKRNEEESVHKLLFPTKTHSMSIWIFTNEKLMFYYQVCEHCGCQSQVIDTGLKAATYEWTWKSSCESTYELMFLVGTGICRCWGVRALHPKCARMVFAALGRLLISIRCIRWCHLLCQQLPTTLVLMRSTPLLPGPINSGENSSSTAGQVQSNVDDVEHGLPPTHPSSLPPFLPPSLPFEWLDSIILRYAKLFFSNKIN